MLTDYLSFVPELSAQVHKRTPAAVEMALRLEDAERAHVLLDEIGIPRVIEPGTAELSLASRVACLHGQLVSAARVLAASEAYPHPHPLPEPSTGRRSGGARGQTKRGVR